jgi:N-acetylmuramoyl-L-alanine amidase
MSIKIGLNLKKFYSNNFEFPKRAKSAIKFIIIHYTGMKKESEAIKKLCDFKSKVSSHYFIKNNGEVLNLVPDLYKAWHAGVSSWKNFKSINKYSIGIEINNPGHDLKYKKFSSKQIFSLNKLLTFLVKNYNIKPQNILGHSDIAPSRKKDPGEKFPWKILAKKELCIWHRLNEKEIEVFRKKKLSLKDERKFIKNLYKIGYCKIKKVNSKKNIKYLTQAFQRRFRQDQIDGKIDLESFLISKNLIKS